MTVWANTNMYHYSAMPFAGTLKVDPNKYLDRPVAVGGSFGSKHLFEQGDHDRGDPVQGDGAAGEVHGGPIEQLGGL